LSELLSKITSSADLKALPPEKLAQVAEEIRKVIIDVVSRRGGHLASNLGIAELTIALHYVFDFPTDRLLWDVGHQCYAHKLLTGRLASFDRLRQSGGCSGFPDPDESPCDLFRTGHAGTAISTAVGMALGDQALARTHKIVAIVGDASIVNGMSLEGMNNAGLLQRQLLVVLNDNSMAIDVTQGALARTMDRLRMTRAYGDIKQAARDVLRRLPGGVEIEEALHHVRDGLRIAVRGQQAFEALGFRYFGPIDGHDMTELVATLKKVALLDRPALLHVHTVKGRGYEYAVEDPTAFHSPTSWRVESDQVVFSKTSRPSWTSAFADTLIAAAQKDPRVVAITAAMPDGTGLAAFRQKFPTRCFDVGISESHAVGMAAGMAKAGLRPVVAIYSTFLQRAIDQIFQEVALQHLPVLFCLDRAGLVGADGAVHHGFMDLAYLRPLPGMTLMAPADRAELEAAMACALSLEGPAAIRYPRDQVPLPWPEACPAFELGRSWTVTSGRDGTFLCYGTMVEPALAAAAALAAEGLDLGVISARFAKPLDVAMTGRLLNSGQAVIIVEDHVGAGGFGAAVLELAAERGWSTANLLQLHLPDRFIAHASRPEQLAQAGLDPDGMAAAARQLIARLAEQKSSTAK
jgi:1-deoxy-D-xylulose-5-phosphate synthase